MGWKVSLWGIASGFYAAMAVDAFDLVGLQAFVVGFGTWVVSAVLCILVMTRR